MTFKRVLFITVIVLLAGTSFTWFHFYEPEHLKFSVDESNGKWNIARPDLSKLQTGDLIFRHGRGFISNALMSFGLHEKKYSHAGIISVQEGKVYVYHSIGGDENKSNKLHKDLINVFCNPGDIHCFGIYRPELSDKERVEIDSLSNSYYENGLEFDTKFDLSTDDKMYCTEFVYKVFRSVLGNHNYLTLSAFSGTQYIACDDLYLNAHCKFIYAYNY